MQTTRIENIKSIFFIGIGGIGMSAIARYFNSKNISVSGYDKTPSPLTLALEEEGIRITFNDDIQEIGEQPDVVVYTPAIPKDNAIYNYFLQNNIVMMKRSDMLKIITDKYRTIAVAGTHGKTTTSSMVAHILTHSGLGCQAFIGGIALNYKSNYWGNEHSEYAVVEADEYDRSFLKLSPEYAILTSIDADHLDIYGNETEFQNAFIEFTQNIKDNGALVVKHGLKRMKHMSPSRKITYSLQNDLSDVYASNITMRNGSYQFDIITSKFMLRDIELNLGGMHNIENAIAAISIAKELDLPDDAIKESVKTFTGIQRRFEYVYKNNDVIYIDDYAHHPEELRPLLKSAKTLFPKKKCVVAFQPHLFSRTRDFARDFAQVLDMADEVILLDIYPARETPIEGITSDTIKQHMGNPNVTILTKEGLIEYMKYAQIELFITAGAGDIDRLVPEIKKILVEKYSR